MRSYTYIARQIPFSKLENFLNEYAEIGFFLVSSFPTEMKVKQDTAEEGSVGAEVFNVIMAQPIQFSEHKKIETQ